MRTQDYDFDLDLIGLVVSIAATFMFLILVGS